MPYAGQESANLPDQEAFLTSEEIDTQGNRILWREADREELGRLVQRVKDAVKHLDQAKIVTQDTLRTEVR
jgi:hypothetical protein